MTETNSKQDKYLLAIMNMRLPGDKMEMVSVGLTKSKKPDAFVALAKTEKKKLEYMAFGVDTETALLELAAKIVCEYPIEENDRRSLDVDIPLAYLVETKAFKGWFEVR